MIDTYSVNLLGHMESISEIIDFFYDFQILAVLESTQFGQNLVVFEMISGNMDVLIQVSSESTPLAFDLESQTDGSYLLATSYTSKKAFHLKTYRFLANQTFEIPASDYNSEY